MHQLVDDLAELPLSFSLLNYAVYAELLQRQDLQLYSNCLGSISDKTKVVYLQSTDAGKTQKGVLVFWCKTTFK